MDKYYTPNIEELHVGFECERFSHLEGRYNKFIFSRFDLLGILDEEENDCFEHHIRAKYLNREDFEDIGFKYTGRSVDLWFEVIGSFEIGSWTSYKIVLHYGLEDNRLYIIAKDHDGSDTHIFEGFIKNKSELIVLLKQLNIFKCLV